MGWQGAKLRPKKRGGTGGPGGKDRVLGSLDTDLIHCQKRCFAFKNCKNNKNVLIIYLEHRFATIVIEVFA